MDMKICPIWEQCNTVNCIHRLPHSETIGCAVPSNTCPICVNIPIYMADYDMEELKYIASHEWVADTNDIEMLKKWIREFVLTAKRGIERRMKR